MHGLLRPAVAGLLLVLAACGGSSGDDGGRVRVVASFYPLAEIADRVGGEHVTVTNLTAPGVEPHDVELTSSQVDAMEDADLVLHIGGGFQPAVEEVVERLGDRGLDLLQEREEEAEDPHFWLDPRRMGEAVDAVTDALSDTDTANASGFRANARTYKAALTALDGEFEQGLATCERREIVTSHAAFHYLAERYDLVQLPISGVSPEAEPDPARLAELADEVKETGITTVFFEELVSPDVARVLARETGAKTAVLSPVEGLTDEQLEAGKDYVAVMRDNLTALRAALGCQ